MGKWVLLRYETIPSEKSSHYKSVTERKFLSQCYCNSMELFNLVSNPAKAPTTKCGGRHRMQDLTWSVTQRKNSLIFLFQSSVKCSQYKSTADKGSCTTDVEHKSTYTTFFSWYQPNEVTTVTGDVHPMSDSTCCFFIPRRPITLCNTQVQKLTILNDMTAPACTDPVCSLTICSEVDDKLILTLQ